MKKTRIDIPFLVSIIILVISGYLIFASASLGLLSKQAVKYSGVAFNQTFLGLMLGSIACYFISKIDYKIYRKYAFYIFLFSIIVTLLVFTPLGVSHGGAKRWLYLGPISFQPSEFLKIGFVIYFSAWIARFKEKIETLKHGLLPLFLLFGVVGGILLSQPDTDTFLVIVFAGLAMYFVSGGSWKHILVLGFIGIISLSFLFVTRPYIKNRVMTYINPNENSQSTGWQIQQSLIAIGSGGLFGRGFGQSIQKFDVLPEPIGDSIFAVAGEEFGFIGTISIMFIFTFFAIRGLKIASNSTDPFGRLLTLGIVIIIISQAFVNIGAMVGVLPLSGITLPFVSHGGTALFMTLAEVGIVLNISKNQKHS